MKLPETSALEKALMQSTVERRNFGVSEVTIGWYGKKRVDFMITNTHGIINCYEIKVTKTDFHSEHGHNFVGNYNYYVMPNNLYKEVKKEIPDGVGVLVGTELKCVKRAKKKVLSDSENKNMILYLVRSMSREVKKHFESTSDVKQTELKRKLDFWRREAKSYSKDVKELNSELKSIESFLRKKGLKKEYDNWGK